MDDYINIDKDIQIEKLINNLIERKFKFKNEVSDIVNRKQMEFLENRRRNLLNKFRKTMILCAIHFKKTNISLYEFYKMKINSFSPFDMKQLQLLKTAINEGENYLVPDILSKNKLLVFYTDKVRN